MTYDATSLSNDFQPEQILGGRYRVLSILGRGGMGVVYKVEQIYLGLVLALKTIDRSALTDMAIRRFQSEAKAVFSLNHPNIISVHDFGLLEDQTPFLAMEFIQGESLATLLKRRTLTVAEALPLFIQACSGLAHAHEHSVVHRDIKPGNIMLLAQINPSTEGSIKILDFGIAKLGDENNNGEIQALTRTGEIFGSPLYMSPEQCAGGKLDHRSDIYSLGCVFFESLTGTTPFVGESALSTMMMHQSTTIPSLKEASLGSDFPKDLEQIVQTMLAKSPDDRYQNLKQAESDLAALARGETLQHVPAASRKQNAKKIEKPDTISLRRETLAGAVVGTVLFSATLGIATASTLLASQKSDAVVQNVLGPIPPRAIDSQEFVQDIKEKKIAFASNYDATDASLAPFQNYDGIQSLKLNKCSVTDAGFTYLQNSKLLKLEVSDSSLNSVKNISKLAYLQDLTLSGTLIDDMALEEVTKLKMLQRLEVRNCAKLTEKGLSNLAKSTSLLDVIVTEKQFSTQAIAALREKMPQCCFEGYVAETKIDEIVKSVKNDALAANKKALDYAEQVNPDLSTIAVLNAKISEIYAQQKKWSEAEEYLEQARKVLQNNGDKFILSQVLAQSSELELSQNKLKERDKFCDEAFQMSIDTTMHDSPFLMSRLDRLTYQPFGSTIVDNAIKNAKVAIALIEQQSPQSATLEKYLAIFYERVGWYLIVQKKNDEAIPYLKKNCELRKRFSTANPNNYAQALVLLGTAESDPARKKAIWGQALDLIESQKYPSELNLRECYCDCCAGLMDIYDKENNREEALKYARRGLIAAEKIEDDIYDRKTYFKKLTIRRLYRAGHSKEAHQEAKNYGFKWSADLE